MGPAGASAREEYERRRAADLQSRRKHYRWKLAIVILTPLLVFTGTQAVLLEPFDGYANLLALLLACVIAMKLASALWGRKGTTEAWRKGAEGEEMTALTLAKLPAAYCALHDLRIPGSRANIDHLVIGPSGVFTVETKHYAGEVATSWGKATRNGRSLASVVDQAAGQAKVVERIFNLGVRPIVCVQGARVKAGLFAKGRVGTVRFCPDGRLNKVITSATGSLSTDEVSRLVDLAARTF